MCEIPVFSSCYFIQRLIDYSHLHSYAILIEPLGYKCVKSLLRQIFKRIILTAIGHPKDQILITFDSHEVSFAPPPNFDTVGIRQFTTPP